MSENPAERARNYLKAIEEALKSTGGIDHPGALRVVDKRYVKRYVADGKYYLESGKPTTALASVAYAEGLLDSLRILRLADARRIDS